MFQSNSKESGDSFEFIYKLLNFPFIFSWRRSLHPPTGSPQTKLSSSKRPTEHRPILTTITRLENLSNSTIRFRKPKQSRIMLRENILESAGKFIRPRWKHHRQ